MFTVRHFTSSDFTKPCQRQVNEGTERRRHLDLAFESPLHPVFQSVAPIAFRPGYCPTPGSIAGSNGSSSRCSMTLGLAAVGGPQEAANVGRVVLVLQGIGEYDFVQSKD